MSAKHGRNRLSNYVEIHATVMSRFVDENFVLVDGLAIDPLGNGQIWIHGHIKCAGGVEITVDKYLAIVDEGPPVSVQTVDYSYNASVSGLGNIFRYDSPHEDHNDFHHRHAYDVFAGDVVGTVTKLTEWPTLGEVIEELRAWTSANADKLTW